MLGRVGSPRIAMKLPRSGATVVLYDTEIGAIDDV
jgi:hypothetical protein